MIPPPPTSTLFPYTTLFRSTNEAATAIASVTPIACCLILDLPCGYLLTDLVQPQPHQPATCIVLAVKLPQSRSEEHTSELQSHVNLVCRLLLEKKKKKKRTN